MDEGDSVDSCVDSISRTGLRLATRNLDKKIWIWCQRKNMTKAQIQLYAKKVFEEAGISSFKASDGWYRRWLKRWKIIDNSSFNHVSNELVKNEKERLQPTVSEKTVQLETSETVGNVVIPQSSSIGSVTYSNVENCETSTNNVVEITTPTAIPTHPMNCSSRECNNTDASERDTVQKKIETRKQTSKKKSERYLPQFKTKVVSCALESSIKNAALKYKVNKGTISDWIRDETKNSKNSLKETEVQSNPDVEFIDWLKELRQNEKKITSEILSEKIEAIIKNYDTFKTHNKQKLWFFTYAKRLQNNSSIKSRTMYPDKFKREVALYAKQNSKKSAGKIFNVARKRIGDWMTCLDNPGETKKTRAASYVTDKKIDETIWNWYQTQEEQPSTKQVRDYASLLYKNAGYNISCSPGWFYRWQARYELPSWKENRVANDLELLYWVLNEFDKNKTVTHAMLLKQASKQRGQSRKVSSGWVIRFSKRHATYLQCIPDPSVSLPGTFEKKVETFKRELQFLINRSGNQRSIVALDEIPINCLSSGKKELLRKTGFENNLASLIISCKEDGTLLRTALIAKGVPIRINETSNVLVLFQPEGINDNKTMLEWMDNIFFKTIGNNAIILCDVYEPHIHLKETFEKELQQKNIDIVVIPGGCSSKLQPICFGLQNKFKSTIESQWEQWQYESCCTSGTVNIKVPSISDILKWVDFAHQIMATTQKELVANSFQSIGISQSNAISVFPS